MTPASSMAMPITMPRRNAYSPASLSKAPRCHRDRPDRPAGVTSSAKVWEALGSMVKARASTPSALRVRGSLPALFWMPKMRLPSRRGHRKPDPTKPWLGLTMTRS